MAREWFAATCNYKIITDNFPPSANKRGRLNGKLFLNHKKYCLQRHDEISADAVLASPASKRHTFAIPSRRSSETCHTVKKEETT